MSVSRTRQLLTLRQRRSHQARLALSAQMSQVHQQESDIAEASAKIESHRQYQVRQEAVFARRLIDVSLSGEEIATSRQTTEALAHEEKELLTHFRQTQRSLEQALASRRQLARTLAERDREVAAIEKLLERERSATTRRNIARAEDDPGDAGE